MVKGKKSYENLRTRWESSLRMSKEQQVNKEPADFFMRI